MYQTINFWRGFLFLKQISIKILKQRRYLYAHILIFPIHRIIYKKCIIKSWRFFQLKSLFIMYLICLNMVYYKEKSQMKNNWTQKMLHSVNHNYMIETCFYNQKLKSDKGSIFFTTKCGLIKIKALLLLV